MAYDSVRAQLDKLLGPDRNGPLSDAATQTAPHYTHDTICKSYLLGFCPNDLHIKHRSEPGSCRLIHSDAAKAQFQEDVQAGKATRDKLRWTRALLKDCRLIVSEEDRKIRGHAKRLQVSYNVPGNLSGLMIRDFNTLKKLGMVSKDAQIKVQMDDEDDDDFTDVDHVSKSNEHDTSPTHATNTPASNRPEAQSPSTKDTKSNGSANGDDNANAGSTNGALNNDDSDDDDDGFDIVPSDCKDKDAQSKETGSIKASDSQSPEENNNAEEDDDDSDFEICSPHSDTPTVREPDSMFEKDSSLQAPSASTKASDDKSSVADKYSSEKHSDDSRSVNKGADLDESPLPPKASTDDAFESRPGKDSGTPKSTDKGSDLNANTKESELTAEQIMNQFYETGKGPDGLMMLDRKQSLRVCACCGGFISLVDAESRLLSHYGGKSHHSLAVLREKVIELEKTVSDLSSRYDEEADRGFNSRREPSWHQRGAERTSSPGWMRRDKDYYQNRRQGGGYANGGRSNDYHQPNHYGRSYSDRGYQRNAHDRRRDGYDRDYGYNHDSRRGDYGRYNEGRKRYRSPSPHRSSRRSRRY